MEKPIKDDIFLGQSTSKVQIVLYIADKSGHREEILSTADCIQ